MKIIEDRLYAKYENSFYLFDLNGNQLFEHLRRDITELVADVGNDGSIYISDYDEDRTDRFLFVISSSGEVVQTISDLNAYYLAVNDVCIYLKDDQLLAAVDASGSEIWTKEFVGSPVGISASGYLIVLDGSTNTVTFINSNGDEAGALVLENSSYMFHETYCYDLIGDCFYYICPDNLGAYNHESIRQWEYPFDKAISTVPLVDHYGNTVVNTGNTNRSFNHSGEAIISKVPMDLRDTPLVLPDGSYLYSTVDGIHRCDNSDSILWQTPLNMELDASLAYYDEFIYVVDRYMLHKLDWYGNIVWTFNADKEIQPDCFAVADNGVLYLVDEKGKLYSVDQDGHLRWKKVELTNTHSSYFVSPMVVSDDLIICTCPQWSENYNQNYWELPGVLIALGSDGSEKWTVEPEAETRKAYVAVLSDSSIVVTYVEGGSSHDNDATFKDMVLLNPDGTMKWELAVPDTELRCPPVVDGNDIIYCASFNEAFAISPTGEILFREEIEVQSYIGSVSLNSGQLIAIEGQVIHVMGE